MRWILRRQPVLPARARAGLAVACAFSMLALAACGGGGGSTSVKVAEARVSAKEKAVSDAKADLADKSAQFCGASKTYILALDRYGDVLNQTAPTVHSHRRPRTASALHRAHPHRPSVIQSTQQSRAVPSGASL